MRFGIGRSADQRRDRSRVELASLGQKRSELKGYVAHAADAAICWHFEGIDVAMNELQPKIARRLDCRRVTGDQTSERRFDPVRINVSGSDCPVAGDTWTRGDRTDGFALQFNRLRMPASDHIGGN